MLKGLIVMDGNLVDRVYGPEERAAIGRRVELVAPVLSPPDLVKHQAALAGVEVIFSGWGAPRFDPELLRQMPRLRAVFYGGGSIRYFVTDEFWKRRVRVTSAYAMNGMAVADYTVGALLFGLKHGFLHARYASRHRRYSANRDFPGLYETTVGIISLGGAGRALAERLRAFDLRVIAYDPFVKAKEVKALGVELVGLDELFGRAEAVSLHTPELPETIGMIRKAHFRQMKRGSVFVNTARGAVVREREMIDVLAERPDLTAILDVVSPSPPRKNSRLFTLPNVVLTPHIAGAMGWECRRMGRCMIDEFDRWKKGQPMRWEVTAQSFRRMA